MSATLTAGRELDALIAEKVMGTPWCAYLATGRVENRNGTVSDFCQRCGDPYGYHVEGRPLYSTNIAAAWLIIDSLLARGMSADLKSFYVLADPRPRWRCKVYDDTGPDDGDRWPVSAVAFDAPLAICRAALAAMEVPA